MYSIILLAVQSIIVAIALGLLEGAWTYPDRGGPNDTWWGVIAIFIILLIVTWPYFWWIPALAILEEITHLYSRGGRITKDRIFNHWSISYLNHNIYPYITFPIMTIIGSIIWYIIWVR